MNKKEFEKLRTEWTKRLKAEGFVDLENEHDDSLYTKAITPEAQEVIKNNDHLVINDVYNQLTDFYNKTDFTQIYKLNYLKKVHRKILAPNDLSEELLIKECGQQLESIFLQYISGESMSQIARNHNITRMQIYPIFKSIIKFALDRSGSIKSEARMFLEDFDKGFGKKGRNGRKAKLKLDRCLCCNDQYFFKDKKAFLGYCGNCITKTEYARGNKKDIVYTLKTGVVIQPKKK